MNQNELYNLVADFGDCYGVALRRDSYLARGIDWPRNWLEIAHEIGDTRAELLCDGVSNPTPEELKCLLRWQVEHALTQQNPEITPTIWLCHKQNDEEIFAVEGWGDSLHTELKFKLIGRYPDQTAAILDIKTQYFSSRDEV